MIDLKQVMIIFCINLLYSICRQLNLYVLYCSVQILNFISFAINSKLSDICKAFFIFCDSYSDNMRIKLNWKCDKYSFVLNDLICENSNIFSGKQLLRINIIH